MAKPSQPPSFLSVSVTVVNLAHLLPVHRSVVFAPSRENSDGTSRESVIGIVGHLVGADAAATPAY